MTDNTASPFVDPQMKAILAAAPPPVDFAALPMAEARKIFEAGHGAWSEPRPPLAEIIDRKIDGPAGKLAVRIYRPDMTPRRPAMLYLHGGGWTFGSIETHDRIMRVLARESGVVVVGLDYRLAPEHPYPAGADDALAALEWLLAGGAGESIDPARLALGGDSAGANIALATLLRRPAEAVRTAILFYGCYVPRFDTPSHQRNGGGAFGLTTPRMRWYWGNYLGGQGVETSSLAAPGRAELRNLPPLYLNAAALDPLLDDTLDFANRLAASGVRYRLDVFPGVVHGFLQMNRDLTVAHAALVAASRHLTDYLSP